MTHLKSLKKILRTGFLAAGAITVAVMGNNVADTTDYEVKLNSVGFLPASPKKASVSVTGTSVSTGTFNIVNAATGEAAHTGDLGPNIRNADSWDTVKVADFTAFNTAGRYYIEVPGTGRSAEFDIGLHVYNEPFRAVMLGMYLWRCGNPGGVDAWYNGIRYQHNQCHINHASLEYIADSLTTSDTARDGTGGWHDAGDFNKYTVNGSFANGMMLKAWEHFGPTIDKVGLVSGSASQYLGDLPKFLYEAKWNLDWLAKMQYDFEGGDGRVSHKVSTRNFGPMAQFPHQETTRQFFVPWGTEATGAFTAVMAQASRIYKNYEPEAAAEWLAKAKLSYDVLKGNQYVAANQTGFSTGRYTTGDADQRLWAAVELWETTGEDQYLQDFESNLNARASNFGLIIEWADVQGLAFITYLQSERTGKRQSLVDSLNTRLITLADALVDTTELHGYGRPRLEYYWGNHGAINATTYILDAAYKQTKDIKYRHAAQEVLGHIFGRNYFGRSYITGVGHNPPRFPHDRRSAASKNAWPGYLVGGPNNQSLTSGGSAVAPPGSTCANVATCYFDYQPDYARNEIAVNWSASVIYALSAFLSDSETYTPPANVKPNQPVRPAAAQKPVYSRIVRTQQNGKLDIPYGARVYTLNGKLVAHRKHGATMPKLKSNGTYIVHLDGKDIKKDKR